jgi:hypothetical protein
LLFIIGCSPDPVNSNTETPAPASNLQATLISPTRVLLSWTDNSTNETGFKIERKKIGEVYSQIGVVATNTSSYFDSTIVQGASYTYRVYSYNNNVNTPVYSNEVAISSNLFWEPVTGNNYTTGQFRCFLLKDNVNNIYTATYPWDANRTALSKLDRSNGNFTFLMLTPNPTRSNTQSYFPMNITAHNQSAIYFCGYNMSGGDDNILTKWNGANWSKISGFDTARSLPIPYLNRAGDLYAFFDFSFTFSRYSNGAWVSLNTFQEYIPYVEFDSLNNAYLSSLRKVSIYNQQANNWTSTANLPNQDIFASKICIDRNLNIIAAVTNVNHDYIYLARWNKSTNTWSEVTARNNFNFSISSNKNLFISQIAIDRLDNIYADINVFDQSNQTYLRNGYIAFLSKANNTWYELGGQNSFLYKDIGPFLVDTDNTVYAYGSDGSWARLLKLSR